MPDPDVVTTHQPAPDTRPVEAIVGKNIAKRVVWIGPPLVLIFGLIGGLLGAMSALVGVAIVAVNFVVAGYLLAVAARVSLSLYHAAALFGFFVRLALITLTMVLIVNVVEIDRIAMGVSAVVSYLGLLTLETIAVSNGAERELEWN